MTSSPSLARHARGRGESGDLWAPRTPEEREEDRAAARAWQRKARGLLAALGLSVAIWLGWAFSVWAWLGFPGVGS